MTDKEPSIEDELRAVGMEPLSNREMRKLYGASWPGSTPYLKYPPKQIPMKELEKMMIEGDVRVGNIHCEVWRGGDFVWIRGYDDDNEYIARYDSETGKLIESKKKEFGIR